ncbi:MAG: hypothetical protein R3E18_01180 [Sphingomonadaceae bacterium]|nr:hypothetical protein [Sphingomonadaceae bacterium]
MYWPLPPLKSVTLAALLPLAACKPPAADEYLERDDAVDVRVAPSTPVASPDTADAVWAPVAEGDRLLFGNPGERAFIALICEAKGGRPHLRLARNVPADARAKALFALIGNGHVERLPMDAVWTGSEWRWEGLFSADDPRLEVFTGPRMVEATLPGAGSVMINPSTLPGQFIARCQSGGAPARPVQ